jgi:hypothetical protein
MGYLYLIWHCTIQMSLRAIAMPMFECKFQQFLMYEKNIVKFLETSDPCKMASVVQSQENCQGMFS